MRFALWVAFIIAVPAFATGSGDSLQSLLNRARTERRGSLEIDTEYEIKAQRVQKAVSRAALASSDAALVVGQVAKSIGVSKDVAAALVEVHLGSRLSFDEIRDAEGQKRVSELLRLVREQAPANADAIAFCLAHDRPAWQHEDVFLATYLPLLRSFSPSEISDISGAMGDLFREIAVAEALGRAPENVLLQRALTSGYAPAFQQTFGPVRLTGSHPLLRESWKGVDKGVLSWEASRQIGALAGAGRAKDALAVFDALPGPARDMILAGSLKNEESETDVRLALAASAVLTGQSERARSLVDPVHPVQKTTFDPLGGLFNERRMLQALLSRELPPDVYEILADTLNSGARPAGGVWSLIFADLAARAGYDDTRTAILRMAVRWTGDEPSKAAFSHLPASLRAELQTTLDADETAIASVRAMVPAMPSADAIHARLIAPRLATFEERPLQHPAQAVVEGEVDCSATEQMATTMSIPNGWFPVRLERSGDEVVGIALSTALDPIGEVGLGAYWVLHSRDGGLSWAPPLYTGLRENAPYVVRRFSKLPLLHGDVLRVAVDIHEIDPDSITFPPIGLRVKREVKDLYLTIPWETLRRDSDQDGVTDLVEERLATDPQSADTDGDGIIDGNDGLPLVPLTAGASPVAEVLATVFSGFRAGGGAIVVGLPSTAEERNSCVVHASAVQDDTLFVVGDRRLVAPIDMHRRVIVFSPDELEAYSRKFGMTMAANFELFIVRHDGQKALVVLNSGWKEDVLELSKTKDGWTVKVVGGWIS